MSLLCLGILCGCSGTSEPEEKQAKNERKDLEIVKSYNKLKFQILSLKLVNIHFKDVLN